MPELPIDIEAAFEAIATDEDRTRRLLIPCFGEFYAALIRAIPFETEDEFSLVELGSGNGMLAALVLYFFPRARLTLIDRDDAAIEASRLRLAGHAERISLFHLDYAREDPTERYDLALSALSLHHNSNLDKRALMRTIYATLVQGGSFIIADRVSGTTVDLEDHYWRVWEEEVRALGAAQEDIRRSLEHRDDDILATLETHLTAMDAPGFRNLDIYYKSMMFAVFGGQRPQY